MHHSTGVALPRLVTFVPGGGPLVRWICLGSAPLSVQWRPVYRGCTVRRTLILGHHRLQPDRRLALMLNTRECEFHRQAAYHQCGTARRAFASRGPWGQPVDDDDHRPRRPGPLGRIFSTEFPLMHAGTAMRSSPLPAALACRGLGKRPGLWVHRDPAWSKPRGSPCQLSSPKGTDRRLSGGAAPVAGPSPRCCSVPGRSDRHNPTATGKSPSCSRATGPVTRAWRCRCSCDRNCLTPT